MISNNLQKAKEALEKGTTTKEEDNEFSYNPFATTMAAKMPPSFANANGIVPSRVAKMTLCEMIKTERKKKGWSQRQLARESGYSQGTITRAEKYGDISFFCLMSLIEALDKKIILTDK